MKVAGRGRIVTWEGASLWIMEVVPQNGSSANATGSHAHHAVQITFALDGRFELRSRGKSAADYAAVAPDTEHVFEAQGLVALLFVEPESEAGRAIIHSLFGRAKLVSLPPPLLRDVAAGILAHDRRAKPDEAVLEKLGRKLVARLAGTDKAAPLDPRIGKILRFAAARLDDAITLGAAAKSAGLSPGRARHLFVAQTGLPFRRYLLWLRINRALALFEAGASLTEAAHEAGFSDSAHFSRTFRRMFGISAAMLELH
jgi:AraC-like DNA-binding protein